MIGLEFYFQVLPASVIIIAIMAVLIRAGVFDFVITHKKYDLDFGVPWTEAHPDTMPRELYRVWKASPSAPRPDVVRVRQKTVVSELDRAIVAVPPSSKTGWKQARLRRMASLENSHRIKSAPYVSLSNWLKEIQRERPIVALTDEYVGDVLR